MEELEEQQYDKYAAQVQKLPQSNYAPQVFPTPQVSPTPQVERGRAFELKQMAFQR